MAAGQDSGTPRFTPVNGLLTPAESSPGRRPDHQAGDNLQTALAIPDPGSDLGLYPFNAASDLRLGHALGA
jgi:hypothetical protein